MRPPKLRPQLPRPRPSSPKTPPRKLPPPQMRPPKPRSQLRTKPSSPRTPPRKLPPPPMRPPKLRPQLRTKPPSTRPPHRKKLSLANVGNDRLDVIQAVARIALSRRPRLRPRAQRTPLTRARMPPTRVRPARMTANVLVESVPKKREFPVKSSPKRRRTTSAT